MSTDQTAARRRINKRTLGIAGAILVVLIIIGAASGGGKGSSSSTATSTPATTTHVSTNPNRPNEATDSYVPSVTAAHPVTVDGIVYKIEGATTTHSVGDVANGLGSTANGIYVILRLRVHSDKSSDAQFTNNLHIVAPGRSYSPDPSATITLTSLNGQTQLGELPNIGSHETVTGEVVFDVAPDTLTLKPQLKLTELGFGDTKGYIDLPALSGP